MTGEPPLSSSSLTQVLQVRLMLREAQARLYDAAVLEAELRRASDSGYLLTLLAFELLLKACLRAHGRSAARTHSYVELWHELPHDLQERLLHRARRRMADIVDYSDSDRLLGTWSLNFVRLRYPFESYESLNSQQYQDKARAWIAVGAPETDAEFVYYPAELDGLIYALQSEIEDWIDGEPNNAPALEGCWH